MNIAIPNNTYNMSYYIEDITPWYKKLTISETTLTSERKNEKDIV